MFAGFINEGILAANIEEMVKDDTVYERKRQCSNKKERRLVMCNGCKTFLNSCNLSNHRKYCSARKKSYPVDLSLFAKPSVELSEQFKKNVLGTLRGDSIGIECRKDQAILLFGYRLYDKIKKKDDNVMGCRKDVRTKMRVLARLHNCFLAQKTNETKLIFKNVKDMFNIDNFEQLRHAIYAYTITDDKKIKASLKTNLQFILVKAANIFKATAYVEKKEAEGKMFEQFQSVLNLWQVSDNNKFIEVKFPVFWCLFIVSL